MVNQANQLLEEIAQRVQDILNAETAVVAEVEEEEILYYAAAVGLHAPVIKGKRGTIATSGLCGTAIESNVLHLLIVFGIQAINIQLLPKILPRDIKLQKQL